MKRTVSLVMGIIIFVFSIVGFSRYLKDHPFKLGKPSSGGGNIGYYDDDNGGGNTIDVPSKKNNGKITSVEAVMDSYVTAMESGDADTLKSLVVDYLAADLEYEINQSGGMTSQLIQRYGADYKITSNWTGKNKMDQDFVDKFNAYAKENGSSAVATECYAPIGTMTISGSKKSETHEYTGSNREETWVCKFQDGYKLVFG